MNIEAIIEKIIEKKLEIEDGSIQVDGKQVHPMAGRRCIIRTYSAGVHFGLVQYVNGTEVGLVDAARLWKWENGGLSLSAVNKNGMKGGRVNLTGEICLTEAIEVIPTTEEFEKSWRQYVED